MNVSDITSENAEDFSAFIDANSFQKGYVKYTFLAQTTILFFATKIEYWR